MSYLDEMFPEKVEWQKVLVRRDKDGNVVGIQGPSVSNRLEWSMNEIPLVPDFPQIRKVAKYFSENIEDVGVMLPVGRWFEIYLGLMNQGEYGRELAKMIESQVQEWE